MSYSTYDFEESISRAQSEYGFGLSDIDHVIAAWGGSSEGGGEWSGGFMMKLKDGRFAYLSGWCDCTGWGCQDGIACEFYQTLPADWRMSNDHVGNDDHGETWSWDEAPEDLNRLIRGEIKRMDE